MANHVKHPHTTETILWGKLPLVYAEQYLFFHFPCLCLIAKIRELKLFPFFRKSRLHIIAHHVELPHLAETKLWGKPPLGYTEQCLFYDFSCIYAGSLKHAN